MRPSGFGRSRGVVCDSSAVTQESFDAVGRLGGSPPPLEGLLAGVIQMVLILTEALKNPDCFEYSWYRLGVAAKLGAK